MTKMAILLQYSLAMECIINTYLNYLIILRRIAHRCSTLKPAFTSCCNIDAKSVVNSLASTIEKPNRW